MSYTEYMGTDPKTGYRMLVDATRTLCLELPVCPCCGTVNALAGLRRYKGAYICKECAAKWHGYLVSKSRLNVRSTSKALQTHLAKVKYWMALRGLAPDGIHEDYEAVSRYLEFRLKEEAEAAQRTQRVRQEVAATIDIVATKCVGCGEECYKSTHDMRAARCKDCQATYDRYRHLRTHLGTLTLDECVEFNKVPDNYMAQRRRGYWSPDVAKYRAKIRGRIADLEE